MDYRIMQAGLLGALLLTGCADDGDNQTQTTTAPPPAQEDADSVLAEARASLGMDGMDSISYSGSAWTVRNSFRQTPSASPPWEWRNEISNYTRTIDLDAPASRASGETFAQNMFLAPAEAGTYTQNIGAEQDAWTQQMEIWLTPWGFVRGAENNGASLETRSVDGTEYRVLSWMSSQSQTSPAGQRYTVNGYVDEQGLVRRVETWVEDAFMGDLHVEAVYDDYQEMNGLRVPATIEQRRAGGGVFGVSVASAEANPADAAERLAMPAPTAGSGGPGGPGGAPAEQPAPADLVEQVGEGVYLVTGGYVALAVEFADHVAVFEAGQSETRGEQILAAVRATLPDKPIRYVVNSHPHSDHTAGLVPFVREGATIVTHASNVEFLDMALSTPRTLLGEETLDPEFMGVEGTGVLEDDSMRLELHHIPNRHSDGMLVAYLPARGILFQADFTLPQPGAQANPFVIDLANYVDENGLDFERYLAVHAAQAPQTKADLMATIGK